MLMVSDVSKQHTKYVISRWRVECCRGSVIDSSCFAPACGSATMTLCKRTGECMTPWDIWFCPDHGLRELGADILDMPMACLCSIPWAFLSLWTLSIDRLSFVHPDRSIHVYHDLLILQHQQFHPAVSPSSHRICRQSLGPHCSEQLRAGHHAKVGAFARLVPLRRHAVLAALSASAQLADLQNWQTFVP